MTTLYYLNNLLDSFTNTTSSWNGNTSTGNYTITYGSTSCPSLWQWFENEKETINQLSVPKVPHNVLLEDDGTLVLEVAATSADKDDIKVTSKDNTLKISVNRKSKNVSDKVYLVKKLSGGNIEFEYSLTEKYDLSKTKVNLERGILYVRVPMKEESKPQVREFKIE